MDQHNNEDCAAQRELEAMHTIDSSGAPRLVSLEEPVERYFKDEGGTSKVLFFGFELHGEITRALRELADSSSRVPLSCELMYEDMALVEPKDDDGKDMFLVLGGLEPDSDRPTLNLTTRSGGVRYHINKVSMRRDGKKYRMRVGIKAPGRDTWTILQPLVSIPTYVASKRSGRNKLERADDSRRRINRLRLRKEQLVASLSRKNKDMVGGLLFNYHKDGVGGSSAVGGGPANFPVVGMPVPAQLRLPPPASGSYAAATAAASVSDTSTQQQHQQQQQQQLQTRQVKGGKRPPSSMVAERESQSKRTRTKSRTSPATPGANLLGESPLSPPTASSRPADVFALPQQQQQIPQQQHQQQHQQHQEQGKHGNGKKIKSGVLPALGEGMPAQSVAELTRTVEQMMSRMTALEQENRDLWRANNDLSSKVAALSRPQFSHQNTMLLSSDSEDEDMHRSSTSHERPGCGTNATMPMLPLSRSWSNDSGRLVSMSGNGTGSGTNGYDESEVPMFDMLVPLHALHGGVDGHFGGVGNGGSNGGTSSNGGGGDIGPNNGGAAVHAVNNHSPLSKPPMEPPMRQFSLSSLPADEGDPIT
jgi:hypothetical protein